MYIIFQWLRHRQQAEAARDEVAPEANGKDSINLSAGNQSACAVSWNFALRLAIWSLECVKITTKSGNLCSTNTSRIYTALTARTQPFFFLTIMKEKALIYIKWHYKQQLHNAFDIIIK